MSPDTFDLCKFPDPRAQALEAARELIRLRDLSNKHSLKVHYGKGVTHDIAWNVLPALCTEVVGVRAFAQICRDQPRTLILSW